jgi:hypothetical protein
MMKRNGHYINRPAPNLPKDMRKRVTPFILENNDELGMEKVCLILSQLTRGSKKGYFF